MTINLDNKLFCRYAFLLTVLCLSSSVLSADNKAETQTKNDDFCQGNYYSNKNQASFSEIRETTLRSGNLLTVNGERNGGIRVKGGDRADILIRACIQTRADSEQVAQTLARNIRIETSSIVRAENSTDKSDWSVSYEILVPRATNLKLSTFNGGIGISGVDGTMEFTATNGGIHLDDIAGDVKGQTINGGLHIELSGNGWKGAGLDVETTNGGVHLSLPETYAARFEAATVNGGFRSEISGLNAERKDRSRSVRLSADLNGGGATIRTITTNGGIHISTSDKSR